MFPSRQPVECRLHYRKIDDDLPRFAIDVLDGNRFAVPFPELSEQRQRIVVIAELHGLARHQGVERAEDRGVTKTLGDAARIERVQPIGLDMQMRLGHRIPALSAG